MKNSPGFRFMKRAALGAALFFVSAPLAAFELEEKPGLKAADERVQRLFDQSVKLHRRAQGNPKMPAEPFRSILTELSLYHEDETATYLSDMGAEGTRSGPIHFAPWALHRLALFEMQQGSYEEALRHFQDLGERFSGAKVIEPADGVMASDEKAEAASLRGLIEAFLALAREQEAKGVVGALKDRIELLQEKFGTEAQPGHESKGTYSELALDALWRALVLDQANYKQWQKATLAFLKREKSEEFQRAILEALAEGCSKLGRKSDADKHLKRASKLKKAPEGRPLPGIFGNLIKA
jgi:tetratricopeptide (TPR) repeat protein